MDNLFLSSGLRLQTYFLSPGLGLQKDAKRAKDRMNWTTSCILQIKYQKASSPTGRLTACLFEPLFGWGKLGHARHARQPDLEDCQGQLRRRTSFKSLSHCTYLHNSAYVWLHIRKFQWIHWNRIQPRTYEAHCFSESFISGDPLSCFAGQKRLRTCSAARHATDMHGPCSTFGVEDRSRWAKWRLHRTHIVENCLATCGNYDWWDVHTPDIAQNTSDMPAQSRFVNMSIVKRIETN